MKIVLPSAEIITEENPLKRIELAGRVCYKSEDKITESSAAPFVQRLIARGHMTPLEHARIDIPISEMDDLEKGRLVFPYGFESRCFYDLPKNDETWPINIRDYLAIGGDIQRVADGEFPMANDFMTVRFICDIGMSRELLRHRVFSACERSTRYVRFDGEIEVVLPVPFEGYNDQTAKAQIWQNACVLAQDTYKGLISVGCSPQEARNVLPLSLKTELVMTGTHDQWKEMLKLRLSPKAHPQMHYLMEKLVELPGFPPEDIEVPKWQPELGMKGDKK